jgi:tRNA-2-methylthio-N6-dimethylallyladenosine synthase
MASASAARTASARSRRSHESFDPLRDPDDAAHAVPGVRADHDRLRQVLHLLHRAQRPRPGAEPRRPAQIVAEARQLADQGCLEITLLGQTVNSYKLHAKGRPDLAAVRPAGALHEIEGIERIKFVTNYPKDMTTTCSRRSATCPRSRPTCTCRPRAARTTVLKRMKRGYTVEEYREMMAASARRCPTRPSPATSSSASAARRRRTSSRRSTWSASAGSRTASSSSTANAPAPRRRALRRRRARRGQARRNNELLAIQNAISEEDNQRSSAGRSRCSSKGRAREKWSPITVVQKCFPCSPSATRLEHRQDRERRLLVHVRLRIREKYH